jgi:hypothetical protein
VILKPMRAFLIRRYLFYVLSRPNSWLRAQKTPRIWGVYKQSKILRHQLERFVSGLELRLQTARRGKVSGPDIWGWRPDFWCTKMDMGAANLGGRSIALGKNIQLFSPEHLQIDQYWLSQRKDLSAQTGASYCVCLDIFDIKSSFLSFAIQLPMGSRRRLMETGVLICRARINFETELHTHLRLNIPELDDLSLQADTHHRKDGEFSWEFRLRPLKLSADSDAPLWIDLIFEAPRYTQIQIIDFNLSTEEGSLERSADVASH